MSVVTKKIQKAQIAFMNYKIDEEMMTEVIRELNAIKETNKVTRE